MTKKKQALLALAREVIALYGGEIPPGAPAVPQPEGPIQAIRRVTVGKLWDDYNDRPFPVLRLRGQWLEQAGFPVGTRVVVQSLPRTRVPGSRRGRSYCWGAGRASGKRIDRAIERAGP